MSRKHGIYSESSLWLAFISSPTYEVIILIEAYSVFLAKLIRFENLIRLGKIWDKFKRNLGKSD